MAIIPVGMGGGVRNLSGGTNDKIPLLGSAGGSNHLQLASVDVTLNGVSITLG